jgi:hypothetical protein
LVPCVARTEFEAAAVVVTVAVAVDVAVAVAVEIIQSVTARRSLERRLAEPEPAVDTRIRIKGRLATEIIRSLLVTITLPLPLPLSLLLLLPWQKLRLRGLPPPFPATAIPNSQL